MKKWVSVCIVSLVSTLAHAECSFKVVNQGHKSFQEMGAKASIANLAIPICTQLEDKDEVVKENCAAAPHNTLFSHPHYESTCSITNGLPIYLQFESDVESVCSDRQVTKGRNVVVNYPEDFSVEKCGFKR